MNKHRLLKLADLLDADAKDKNGVKFDLNTFAHSDHGDPQLSCNTYACALGLAALSGTFKRAGLSHKVIRGFHASYIVVRYGRAYDLAAGAKLFDIRDGEASFLFSPINYGGKPLVGKSAERAVAKRIRKFVADDGRP